MQYTLNETQYMKMIWLFEYYCNIDVQNIECCAQHPQSFVSSASMHPLTVLTSSKIQHTRTHTHTHPDCRKTFINANDAMEVVRHRVSSWRCVVYRLSNINYSTMSSASFWRGPEMKMWWISFQIYKKWWRLKCQVVTSVTSSQNTDMTARERPLPPSHSA